MYGVYSKKPKEHFKQKLGMAKHRQVHKIWNETHASVFV